MGYKTLAYCCCLVQHLFFVDPGLDNPEPVGKYLNEIFPVPTGVLDPYTIAFDNFTFDSPLTFTLAPG